MFDLQDPTQRGPLFTYLGAFVAAEQKYLSQRNNFLSAVHFTLPSFLTTPVQTPQPSPVTHITDVIPQTVTNVLPDSVTHAINSAPKPSSLWAKFRGAHGG